MSNLEISSISSLRALFAAFGIAAAMLVFAPTTQAQSRDEGADSAQSTEVVNIQTASAEQLQLLPGIGPAKAQAIISHRERRAFRRVQDIMRVRGIGRATFRHLRSMLTVDGPTTLASPVRRSRSASTASE
ncbi:MAG TPA: helix-hairpin-helix domain-containing protein [Polyangiaceae bacterium]|nr:helix-hairpin-helix domain-containing protein [Polyangiaceae bacterium]